MKARIVGAVTIAALMISAVISESGWTQDLFSDPAQTLEQQERALEQKQRLLEQHAKALEQETKFLEQRAAAIEQAVKHSALAEGMANDEDPRGYEGGYERYGMARFGGNRRPLRIDRMIGQMVADIRDATTDEARADATNRLREMLDQYFEQDMKVRAKELEGVAARVEKLQTQLDRRREKKQEIVDLQVKVLLNEAEGLGFYSQPKDAEYFNLRVPTPIRVPVEPGAILIQPPPPLLDLQPLSRGAEGDAVRLLQQALNERMEPSPNIAVDGDFGPETETAVKTFQAQHGMKETGVADAATCEMLDMEPTRHRPTSK